MMRAALSCSSLDSSRRKNLGTGMGSKGFATDQIIVNKQINPRRGRETQGVFFGMSWFPQFLGDFPLLRGICWILES